MPLSKKCCNCCTIKISTEFYSDKRMKDGLLSRCKECSKRYYNSRKEKNNTYRRSYRQRHPLEARKQQLKYIYGLSYQEYESIKNLQQSKCQLCKKEKDLQVDHNHINNKIRGLLCGECNKVLGIIEKYEKQLPNFLSYLKERENGLKGYYRLCQNNSRCLANNSK